ncbi:MAG TPA: MFS transporter [Solirubrobacteraceae bacterium]|jgi:MFS family permease|nr:MFS transporter [Solirubrobacteraceae bacterium]
MSRRSLLALLGTAQFVMVLDTTVMNVSITQVVSDLHTTVEDVQAAITLYALVMAAFMLSGAKLGDLWGRRRAFTIGLAIYGLGSLITALSTGIAMLLVGWSLIEGLGAVLVIPAIAALVATNFQGRERALAYATLGGIAGAAVAAGPLIGGFITTVLSWRVVFAAETATVLVMLPLCRKIGDIPPQPQASFDRLGAALSALGLGLIVFAILQSSQWGFLTPRGALEIGGQRITPFGFSVVPFLIAAGAIVLGLFARLEQRLTDSGRTPLLAPDLLRVPRLRAGASMLVAQQLIIAGTFFVLPLYLQLVLGKDALQTGVTILPVSIAMIVGALAGPRLARRSSPRGVVRGGLALLCAGLLGMQAAIGPTLASLPFAAAIAGFGAGMGLVVSQLGNVIMSSVARSRSSEAGGVQGAAQNLGASLGTALIGAVLLGGLLSGFQSKVRENPDLSPSAQQQVLAATDEGVAMTTPAAVGEAAHMGGLSDAETASIVASYSAAQLDALKRALLCASAFALVSLWFAGRLPGEPLDQPTPESSEESAEEPAVVSPPGPSATPA